MNRIRIKSIVISSLFIFTVFAFSAPADAKVTSTVGIGPRAEGGFGLTVALAVDLPGLDKALAEELVHKAHAVCPYSNATRNNIDVALSVV